VPVGTDPPAKWECDHCACFTYAPAMVCGWCGLPREPPAPPVPVGMGLSGNIITLSPKAKAALRSSSPASPAPESREALDEQAVREWLWFNHGHVGLYGDDGELQCSACSPWDYKRAPLLDVVKAAVAALASPAARREDPVSVSVTELRDHEVDNSPVESVDLFLRGRGISLLVNVPAGSEASYSYEVEGQDKGRGLLQPAKPTEDA
jgi:hypothetical protein